MTATPLSRMQKKTLLELFEGYHDVSGYGKLVSMSQIRDIVLKKDIRSMIDFIETINEPFYLDILLGCGMRGTLWQAVIKRKAILSGL